jgi:hypothetical protein
MKKILVLLVSVLSTISVFGQSQLDFSKVNSVTQVGDQLVVKFQYFKDPDMGEATLTQFDFQYNNKLLAYVSHEWQVASTSAQKARNSWNGYKFIEDGQKGITDYDGQYVSWLGGDASYGDDADWSVERITIQDVDGYPHESEFVKYTFTIKDKGVTNYTDYSDLIQANWANYKESDGTQIDVTSGAAGQSLSLTDIKGGDAGDVALSVSSNVITNNIGDGSHFGYSILTQEDFDNQNYQNVVASGFFDTAGDATVQGLENDTEYHVSIFLDEQQEYLDEAVTVSDLALIFQEAIGAGNSPNGSTTTFDYHIQKLIGNVTSGPEGINFQDSYEVLAYLQGIDTQNQVFISKTGNAYNLSGLKDNFGDQGNYFIQTIKPTDDNKTFAFAHALSGDVNFSHGFQPTSQNAVMTIAQGKSTMSIKSARYTPQTVNMDLVSELKDGKVIFYINSDVEGMVGSQFNIVYDRTRLVLDNVVFDTGNTMTNFVNHLENEGKINVGSFDQNFESFVKVGTPYKIIFIPTVELNNTSGLVSFKVKEGVKADGTQINFILN